MDTKQLPPPIRRRLGRGLSALIGDAVPVSLATESAPANGASPAPTHPGSDIMSLPCASIVPSTYQPRREFDPVALGRLADSIRRAGVMQPIIVRPRPAGPNSYELVAGERRWRAAQLAGLTHVPALVRDLSEEESAEWALIENLQREDLNPMDRAFAIKSLCDLFGLRQEDVAQRIGLDRSTVANLIRLNELEPQLQALVAGHALSSGHGRALLGLPPGEARVTLGARCADERWSVRRLESEIAALLGPALAPRSAKDPEPRGAREAARGRIERQLSEHLGTKVTVTTDRSGTRGRITVEFYGLDHFEGLLNKLGVARTD